MASDDVKKEGAKLNNAGVIGPELPDRKFNAQLSATTYGAGMELDFLPVKYLSLGASVHTGGPALEGPVVMGRADLLALQKEFDTNSQVGPITLKAGPFGGVAYDNYRGITPVIGGTVGVEHVKSGFNAGFDIGVSPLGSSNSHDNYKGYYNSSHVPFVGGKIGWKF